MNNIRIDARINSNAGDFVVSHLIERDDLINFIYNSLNHMQIIDFAIRLIISMRKGKREFFIRKMKEQHEMLER